MALFLAAQHAHGQSLALEGDIYRNPKLGLTFTVPEGWRMTRQTGYPSIVAKLYRRHSRSQLAISVAELGKAQGLKGLLQANVGAMATRGIKVLSADPIERMGRRLWLVVAQFSPPKGPPVALRQLYMRGATGAVIITLACPPKRLSTRLADLDYLLESLKLGPGLDRSAPEDEDIVEERPASPTTQPSTQPASQPALRPTEPPLEIELE